MAQHNDLGFWGEQQAATFLEQKGYRIMRRNWRCGSRDIDIIATNFNELIIVEVKTRRDNAFTDPATAVDAAKIRSLSIATDVFVKKERIDLPIRFDIVAVTGTPQTGCTIDHIEDAFMPITR